MNIIEKIMKKIEENSIKKSEKNLEALIEKVGPTIEFGMYANSLVEDEASALLLNKMAEWRDDKTKLLVERTLNFEGKSFLGLYYTSKVKECPNSAIWFRKEPIKWTILDMKNGKTLLWSDMVLSAKLYAKLDSNGIFTKDYQGNSTVDTVSKSNYQYSFVREWLNTQFCENAFSEDEKEILDIWKGDDIHYCWHEDYIEFFEDSGINKYKDKVFLMNYSDLLKTFVGNRAVVREFIGEKWRYKPLANPELYKGKATVYSKFIGNLKVKNGNVRYWSLDGSWFNEQGVEYSDLKRSRLTIIGEIEAGVDDWPNLEDALGVRPAICVNSDLLVHYLVNKK